MSEEKRKRIEQRMKEIKKEIAELREDLNGREDAAKTYGSEIVTGEFCGSARFLRERISNLGRELIRLEAGII